MSGALGEARPGGLEAVFLERREALLRFLRARGAGEEAEDLVHDLWLRLAAHRAGPVADPVGYLYRAAQNLMISRHRAARRSGARDGAWAALADGEVAAGEAALIARDDVARAEARLRALGARPFEAFVLFRVDGLSQRAIAERLGVSLSSVEKDLQRAYRAMAGLREG